MSRDRSPLPRHTPLEFDRIPHRDGLFIHFDANSRTYLVQAFFKADTLADIRNLIPRSDPISVIVPQKEFDSARDAFLGKLIASDAPPQELHTR